MSKVLVIIFLPRPYLDLLPRRKGEGLDSSCSRRLLVRPVPQTLSLLHQLKEPLRGFEIDVLAV